MRSRVHATALPRASLRAAAWLGALALVLAAYAVVTLGPVGGAGVQDFFGRWVYDLVVLGAAGACLVRALRVRHERGAWLALAGALLLWALGQTYYSAFLYYADPAPYPSPADAFFLAFYPASYIALFLLMRSRAAGIHPLAWIDGLIGALAVTAVAAALIFPRVLDVLGGSALGVAVSLAYPVADLFLLGMVVGALAVSQWRGRGVWLPIAAALLLFGSSDVVYLSVSGQATAALDIASVGWPLAFLLLAGAAWLPAARPARPRSRGDRRIALPIGFAIVGILLLVVASFHRIGATAVLLVAASLVAVLARLAITFDENRRVITASRREALTDSLTSLGNRRKLMRDLGARLESARQGWPCLFAIFDLDGFKQYNDSFGHASGDAMLRRLGRGLVAAIGDRGRGYRLGGDEFCVLVDGDGGAALQAAEDAARALHESGEGFTITCSYGCVALPDEAPDISAALRIADQRMYRAKQRGRVSAGRQSTDVLVRVLEERIPEMGDHLRDVSRNAVAVGKRVGLAPEELDDLVAAAELHDVGKLAIPDAILARPDRLDADEESFLRQHAVIGERIVNAAPALSSAGRVVRACHERFDGTGYPDGLAGEEIPLGARIIAVCDAFDAMVSIRTSGTRCMAPEAAIAELLRESGSWFDPAVVRAFEQAWEASRGGEADGAFAAAAGEQA